MNVSAVDLKKTVNLPKTDFSMKANLPITEPKALEQWEIQGLYHRLREVRRGRPKYILHDGPPYANGNIHLGTAFNKVLKDFIVKSKSMAGFDAPYVPGWDCHGLPIEFKVDHNLGKRKATMTVAEIRAECRAYAAKFVDIHRREFKRLGILGEWAHPYLTMSAEYEAVIAQAFVDFLHHGYVYKGLKPVHWCILRWTWCSSILRSQDAMSTWSSGPQRLGRFLQILAFASTRSSSTSLSTRLKA
jgi:isoleucyl-tRNA synthetase